MAVTNNQASPSLLDNLKAAMQPSKDTTYLGDGVNEDKSDDKTLGEILSAITGMAEQIQNQTDSYNDYFSQDNSKNPLEDIDSFMGGLLDDNKKDSKGSGQKTKDKPSPADVLKLDANYGLGSLLIYYKLDEISAFLKSSLGGEGKKGGDSKGGGIAGIFQNIVKGATGIGMLGIGLMTFAGSMVVFNSVDWGKALVGVALMSGVVLGAIYLAKGVGDNIDTFLKFTIGVSILSVGFMAFATALVIMNYATSNIFKAIGGLLLFTVFVNSMAAVAKGLEAIKGDIINFGITSLLLAASFIVFGAGLYVLDKTMNPASALKALAALVAIVATFAIIGLIGAISSSVAPAILAFGVSSILISVGLMTFGLSLLVLEKTVTPDRMDKAIKTLASITVFCIAVAVLAAPIAAGAVAGAMLAVFSVSLLVSSLALAGAINMLQFSIGKDEQIAAFLDTVLLLSSGMGVMALFLAPGVIGSALLTVFSVTMLASTLAIWGVVSMMSKFSFKTGQIAVGSLLLIIAELSAGLALLSIPLTLGMYGAVKLAAFSALTVPGLLGFASVFQALDKLKLDTTKNDIYLSSIKTMTGIMVDIVKMMSTDIKDVKKQAKVFSEVMKPVTDVFLNMFDMLKQISAFTPPDNLEAQVTAIMNSLQMVCKSIEVQSVSLEKSSKKAIKKFGEAFLPVSEMLVNMMSVLKDTDNMGLDNAKAESLISGISSLLNLMSTQLFKAVNGIGKIPSVKNLSKLTDLLTECNKIIDLINKNDSGIDVATYLNQFKVSPTDIAELTTSLDSLNEIAKQIMWLGERLDGTKTFTKSVTDMAGAFTNLSSASVNLENSAAQIGSWYTAVSQLSATFANDPIGAKLDMIANSFQSINNATQGMDKSLEPLERLAANEPAIVSVAKAIKEMAEATKGMNGAAINSVDSLFGAKNKAISSTPVARNTASFNAMNDTPESAILLILQEWKKSGFGRNANMVQSAEAAKNGQESPDSGGPISSLFKWWNKDKK